jgi:hypothetical protein
VVERVTIQKSTDKEDQRIQGVVFEKLVVAQPTMALSRRRGWVLSVVPPACSVAPVLYVLVMVCSGCLAEPVYASTEQNPVVIPFRLVVSCLLLACTWDNIQIVHIAVTLHVAVSHLHILNPRLDWQV